MQSGWPRQAIRLARYRKRRALRRTKRVEPTVAIAVVELIRRFAISDRR
jgi:hypothetical protein